VAVLDEADFHFTSDHLDLTLDNKEQVMEPTVTLEKLAEIVTALSAKVDAMCSKTTDADDKMMEEKKTEDSDYEEKDEKETKDEDDKEKDTTDAIEVKALRTELNAMKKDGIKALVSELSQRDALVRKLSPEIGTFDHADKTLSEVAVYGAQKLGLKVAAGQEIAALDGYFAAKKTPNVTFAMDSKPKMAELDAYINKSNA